MSDEPDRRSADRQLFRDLVGEMEHIGEIVEKLATKVEAVAILGVHVETNTAEIQTLRQQVEALGKQSAALEVRVTNGGGHKQDGSLRIQPGWLSAILVVVGFVLTGLWKLLDYLFSLAKTRP